jgi:hypothetical protein
MTLNSQFSKANMYTEQPPTRKITLKAILYIVLALLSIVLWIHHLFVPSLPGNWLWISGLFILGSGGLILLDFNKRRSGTQKAQQSFLLLIWLCSILEVALIALVFVMQFNGNANVKGLSENLLSGALVSLFTWLAYRAYRYVDCG